MSDVFADTFYFIALIDPQDEAHDRAIQATANRADRLVTTVWVLAEVGNLLSRGRDRTVFVELLEALRSDALSLVIPADQEHFDRGVELFASRPDKEWSLTDCISFQAMEEMNIVEALTADHHFEQAGFRAVLK